VGKFTGIDPYNLNVDKLTKILSDPQKLHSYLYSRGNPIVLVDPDGNTDVDFAKGLAVGVGVRAYQTGVAVIHPIDTAKSLGNLLIEGYSQGKQLGQDVLQNPSQTFNEIGTGLGIQTREFLATDDYTRGQAVGGAAFDTFLMVEGVMKSSKITTQLDNKGLKLTGERYQLAVDPYERGGGGIILRDTLKSDSVPKQRVVSLDIHQLKDSKWTLPHIDANITVDLWGFKMTINLHQFPWTKK
jgi:hypothetical protein